jgi:uncharacterized protein YkwD
MASAQPKGMAAAAVALAAVLGAACRPARLREPVGPPVPVRRAGPDRTRVPYDDPRAAEKAMLLARINADRAAHGVPPVAHDPRAAAVGDAFCLESALSGSWGHWDTQGRPPYLRWGLAGGVDYHAQNVGVLSVSSGEVRRPLAELMLEVHASMMAETPPQDGHRRLILDPQMTHVGIGVAVAGGEFRLSQEFTRAVFEWIEVPAGALRAGERAVFAGQVPPGWEVGAIEIRHDPPHHPLSLAEVRRRGSYSYPKVVATLHPKLPRGTFYDHGGGGDFQVEGPRVRAGFPVPEAGHYFVLCYLRRKGGQGGALYPATAALVVARP